VYGTLVNTELDSFDNGNIVFNLEDVVRIPKGKLISSYVQAVSFNFSVAPFSSTPTLWLYVLNAERDSFYVYRDRMYKIPYSLLANILIGNHTVVLPSNMLPILPGQYLAVGFDEGGGSCYRTENQTQYSQLVSDFSSVFKKYYYSRVGGTSFSFVVHTTATTLL
jgi:hypothetical protein